MALKEKKESQEPYWFKENPEGTIKTADDTLASEPSEVEQTVVIDLAKSGISSADQIKTIHMHDSPGNGKFTIKEAKFTNSPKEVKSISIPWMAKEYNPGEGEGYQYLAGIDLADLNVTMITSIYSYHIQVNLHHLMNLDLK